MRISRRKIDLRTGPTHRSWPVLLLLVLLILIPTWCVLWFMNEAVRNERLAVREKLRDAYRGHLAVLRERMEQTWQATTREVDRLAAANAPAVTFSSCVRKGLADSVLIYDDADRLRYPNGSDPPPPPPVEDADWQAASRLEYVDQDFAAAAAAYSAIAESHTGAAPAAINQAARAWQAVARCYSRAGEEQQARRIVTQTLGQPEFASAVDPYGRLIVADAELRAIELWRDRRSEAFGRLTERLAGRLNDYEHPGLPASQRRFLMSRMRTVVPGTAFPTFKAEQLAARFLESQSARAVAPVMTRTKLPDVWQLASDNSPLVLLFSRSMIEHRMHQLLSDQAIPQEVTFEIVPPSVKSLHEDLFLTLPTGSTFPGWRLTLTLNDREVFTTASRARVTAYLWTGTLGIGVIAALVLFVGRSVRNQTRLARLKNDLLATITHELKTPLASMRLLVDTLVGQEHYDQQQVQDYMQLISRENQRLSRLIDNFLAFSRIERNRYRFDFRPTAPAEIIEAAVDASGERLQAANCHFAIELESNLPDVIADKDALVTVVLNLLDNAYKYSGEAKHITLKVYSDDAHVCLAVQDNGIGLSARERKRIFRRFYQVDQQLSRAAGGCGLGLSIVNYIVRAHGGRIHVDSRPGRGSTFTVVLAAVANTMRALSKSYPT